MADLQGIAEALIRGDRDTVAELAQQAIDEGVAPQAVLDGGLVAGMNVVGKRFKNNEFYVPEVLIAARAMHAGMDIIKPLLAESETEPAAIVAIGTVKGDLHDIGKNLVSMMLEGAGFQVHDLGVNVEPAVFVEKIQEGTQLVALSALLTTTMPAMAEIIKATDEAGVRDKVKIIIGGAPVTQSYADEIGADGFAADAASAVDIARELLGLGA